MAPTPEAVSTTPAQSPSLDPPLPIWTMVDGYTVAWTDGAARLNQGQPDCHRADLIAMFTSSVAVILPTESSAGAQQQSAMAHLHPSMGLLRHSDVPYCNGRLY